jgi:putative tryptophan/tyrosine transport system substrate-binding protein
LEHHGRDNLIKRREFIAAIGSVAIWPLASRAQQPSGRVYRIGFVIASSRTNFSSTAFEDGLRNLGYRIGQNVVIEYRFADGKPEQLPALADELVKLSVDVLVAGSNPSVVAAMKATTTVPIVGYNIIDPVGAGLVASLARPGGNVTGLTGDTGHEIWGKRLELMKQTVPNLSRVGVLWNPDVRTSRLRMTSTEEAARALGLTLVPVITTGPDDLQQAFATMASEQVQAFVLLADTVLFNNRRRIAEMALSNRLPATSDAVEFGEAGFVFVYGLQVRDLVRQSAIFVDKIFKGAKPADLPVEQPTKFVLVVNMKTAKALSLEIPPNMLTGANEVIE